MYIKSIVLDGFKSYGQRTEIVGFDPQFNAITGLNGSGKSNILDAICFVLGITNLTHVRAGSLQDLIYKSGQAGINKATVSITFDNRDPVQCPPGFENVDEITITRQIVIGGKNKYLINGTNVPNKKVQDLFCSVQLNVNNPHFLIMQGKITKVLNMKPPEILAMVEEAAGTRMYEVKRQSAQKHIEKKDAKIVEFKLILQEEVSPKLDKLRVERAQYLEYQRVERELEHLLDLYHVWQYFEAQRKLKKANQDLQNYEEKVKSLEQQIDENKTNASEIEKEIELMVSKDKSETTEQLKSAEEELRAKEKQEVKINASLKSVKENINSEEKKIKQIQKNIHNDEQVLSKKQEELNKVQLSFETLKQQDREDSEAVILSQKKYEALCAGMEVNENGEAETLAEQLMAAKEEVSKATTGNVQVNMKIKYCQSQLNEKQKDLVSHSISDYDSDVASLKKGENEIKSLEAKLSKLNYSEEAFHNLQDRKRQLQQNIRKLSEHIENFEAQRPYTCIKYRDPETNFDRSRVKGVVCKLINCKDPVYFRALEVAAGGKLYNVVTDTDVTSKSLLQRGNLQNRTTFIPMNKISARRIDQKTVRLAEELVGKENCQLALSLIEYNKNLTPAMEFVFGNVFVCRDMNVAKKVTFHKDIKKKCVTLEGDSTDPSGTLSGGARMKGNSVLAQIKDIAQYEESLKQNEHELVQLEKEMRELQSVQGQYNSMKQKLDMLKHEMLLLSQKLQNSRHYQQQKEVDDLKAELASLNEQLKANKETEKTALKKVKELEVKMKDSVGYREKCLKEAEDEMKKLKNKAEKSKNAWRKKEQDYETLNLEIEELKKSIIKKKEDITQFEENIKTLQKEYEEITENSVDIKNAVKELQDNIKRTKAIISDQNQKVHQKKQALNKLLSQNNEKELEIKKLAHETKNLQEIAKISKNREQELAKKIKSDNSLLKRAEELTAKESHELERRIKIAQDQKSKLGRTVNKQAQSMFEHEEKKFNELIKKLNIVENDKKKIQNTIHDLDQKKTDALKLAFVQVSKDFGSIFGTLLPGANAKLVPPLGKTILQGLEIKVSLGGDWKESLTELSGGQRSLAALSLILAMLLFKPAPLYILDEVDAALDLSHTQNIGTMLRTHFKQSQFIIVSLKDGMFSNANILFRTKFIDGISTVQRTVNKAVH